MTLSIEVHDLHLRYGDVTALDGMTFTLAGGKIYGLLGRNGSGKTSLLSVLAAFRKESAGTVRIDGQPVFENARITSQVCLVRETADAADKGERVHEALHTAGRLRSTWDADYASALLDRFEVPRDAKVGALSLGKRSALGIVVGLASRCPVTMFDESHLGMDVPSRNAFHDELLVDFMAHPRTIIVSTHLIEEVSALFEEVLIIDNGRLLLRDDAEALRTRGAAVTGPTDAVDRFVEGMTVLGEKRLGRTKSATVYGTIGGADERRAREAGLDLGPISLQDLFVHLTEPAGGAR
jgi:ABC-2 type transport system ATP-binding protein